MPAVFDGEIKDFNILVSKVVLPQFLEQCKRYSCMMPEITNEFIRGKEEFWVMHFTYMPSTEENE